MRREEEFIAFVYSYMENPEKLRDEWHGLRLLLTSCCNTVNNEELRQKANKALSYFNSYFSREIS
jgi:hypothetical protein